jgi:hypothetical protein
MSTIKPIALYQIETFGAGIGHGLSRNTPVEQISREERSMKRHPGSTRPAPSRAPDFLTHLMVDGDTDLRKKLGRRDIAESREAAYSAALANRPSARPLSFLRVLGAA